MENKPSLFLHFPQSEALPYKRLAKLPTPIEQMARLGDELDMPQLYIKRDDLSGELYGGNKTRKLEFIFGEALEQGHDRVLTIGAIGSHHVLATSIWARHLGLKPAAQHFPQPVTDHVLNNLRALSTTTPELSLVGHPVNLPFKIFKQRLSEWMNNSPRTYFVQGGGSSVLGVIGYVSAAFELVDQIEEGLIPEPDYIFVAAGTNGTFAGLALGCKLAGLRTHVIGVRVVDKIVTNSGNVVRLANQAAQKLRSVGVDAPTLTRQDITLLDQYFGPNYGVPTSQGARAIDLAERFEKIKLDPTYTGKTFAAILGERIRLGLKERTVLYWNTLSSVDLSARIERANIEEDLPASYRVFFKESS